MSAIARYVPPSVVSHMQSMQHRLANMRDRAKEQEQTVVSTVASALTGATFGFLDGRYDRRELGGAPIAPVAGVLTHIGGFVVGGKDGAYLHSIGDAAIAVGMADIAREFGKKRKASSQNTGAWT
jgi:hypothetical protein